MPNPYRYTQDELRELKEEFRSDPEIEWELKEFIMWQTAFTEREFDVWSRTGQLPRSTI